jgi:glycerol dehydrogenase-like iron-containing ADH family enzyme
MNRTSAPQPRPLLKFAGQDLRLVVREFCAADTLIVTDDYNYPLLADLGRTIAVEDTDAGMIKEVSAVGGYSGVVAIGGCTALDFGRACVKEGQRLVAVPTILSNCCISSDRSVIRHGESYRSEKTAAPEMTVISLPTVEENHADRRKNWSASGLGDLFSAFAAVAETHWASAMPGSRNNIFQRHAPICSEALEWVVSVSYPLDIEGLKRLAELLHEFSIVGHVLVPTGSEHALYYALRTQQNYPRMVATHGKLVSIGTLLTLRAWSELNGDFSMYNALQQIYGKIGLPVTYDDLKRIGVMPEHIISAWGSSACDGLYGAALGTEGITRLLEKVFG